VKIAVNPLNLIKNNKEKNVKKWYYLKNKNGELMLKLLLSIDIYSMLNLSNNIQNDNKKKIILIIIIIRMSLTVQIILKFILIQ